MTKKVVPTCTCGMEDRWVHLLDCDLWSYVEFSEGLDAWNPFESKLTTAINENPPDEWWLMSMLTQDGVELDQPSSACKHNLQAICDTCGVVRSKENGWLFIPSTTLSHIKDYVYGLADDFEDDKTQEPIIHSSGKVYDLEAPNGAIVVMRCTCKPPRANWCYDCNARRVGDSTTWVEIWEGDKPSYKDATSYMKKDAKKSNKQAKQSWPASTTPKYQYIPKCRHYGQEVVFPDGTRIVASSQHTRNAQDVADDTASNTLPAFGVYMASSWQPKWLAFYLNWTDHGLPQVPDDDVMYVCETVKAWAQKGIVVEIGCIGGHGRTGALMACIAQLCGVKAADAAQWVWDNYCKEAIESKDQEWYIIHFGEVLAGVPEAEQTPKPVKAISTYGSSSTSQSCLVDAHKALWMAGRKCWKKDCQWWDSDVANFIKNHDGPLPTPISEPDPKVPALLAPASEEWGSGWSSFWG